MKCSFGIMFGLRYGCLEFSVTDSIKHMGVRNGLGKKNIYMGVINDARHDCFLLFYIWMNSIFSFFLSDFRYTSCIYLFIYFQF